MKNEREWTLIAEARALVRIAKASASTQPRHPAGSPKGGQFAAKGGGVGSATGAFVGARLGAAAGIAAGVATGLPGAAKVGMALGGGIGIHVGSQIGGIAGTFAGMALDAAMPKLKTLAAKIKEIAPDLDLNVEAMADGLVRATEKAGLSQENFSLLQSELAGSSFGKYFTEANAINSLKSMGDTESLRAYESFLGAQGTVGKADSAPSGEATLGQFLGAAYAYARLAGAGRLPEAESGSVATETRLLAEVAKIDADQQLVYGWASVYEQDGRPVIDKQGDRISETEVVKMAQRFITEARVAKRLHAVEPVGAVVESLVLTHEIQKALGVDLGKAGWFVGIKVNDPETWARVKSGELRTLSIGGRGVRTPMELEKVIENE
jgi:hypothetical protein